MTSAITRKDLLFATVAVERGLIRPEQLVALAQPEPACAGASLADRMVAGGLIDARERMRIDDRVGLVYTDQAETVAGLPAADDEPPTMGEDPAAALVTRREPLAQPRVTPPEREPLVVMDGPERYRVEGLRGEGGQGRILVAFDRNLGREVALKEYLGDPDAACGAGEESVADVERFLREVQVTGQLEHPNIVPVYELARRPDGALYYTMRLVRGQTLGERIHDCRSLDERLRLLRPFSDLCNAIAFAHHRGVVHRDIKSSNVMVNEFGQTVVLDWGVAKVKGKKDITSGNLLLSGRSATTDETAVGTAIGTPAYMSPEQASGDIQAIDERSDVWGLGAVLYEMLTGRPPFIGEDGRDTMRRVRELPLRPVKKRSPAAPPELAAICEKALQKKKADRYRSASQLATEIDAYMAGARVRAYRYSAWELLRRFASQHRAAFAATSLILLVIVGALVVVSLSWRAESQARARERAERLQAEFHLAQAFAEKAARLADERDHAAARVFAAAALLHNPAHPHARFHDAGFSAREPLSRELWVGAASTVYRLRQAPGAELIGSWETPGVPTGIAVSPDGTAIAVPDTAARIEIRDSRNGRLLRTLEAHGLTVMDIAFSPDGTILAAADSANRLVLWDWRQGVMKKAYEIEPARAYALSFAPDGEHVALANADGVVRVVKLASGRARHLLRGHRGGIMDVAFSPDGHTLASAGHDNTVRLWDTGSGVLARRLEASSAVMAVRFAPGGEYIASAGFDGSVHTWEVKTGKLTLVIQGHTGRVAAIGFSPDGRVIASGSADTSVRLWDAATGDRLLCLRGHQGAVSGLAFSPDGATLVTADRKRAVRQWRLRPASAPRVLAGHSERIYALSASADGRFLASGAWDAAVVVWRRKDAGEGLPAYLRQVVLRGHDRGIRSLAFDPGGDRLASTSMDGTVRIWHPLLGETLHVLRGHERSVYGVAFSPDGKRLATGSEDRTVRLWDAEAGQELRKLEGHTDAVFTVVFSPDGKRLVSAGYDKTVRIWDAETGAAIRTLEAHTDRITGLDISPDGRWIASAGKDATAIIWNAETGEVHARLEGHARWVNRVCFSPDGKLLATASDDRTVRVTTVDPVELLLILPTRSEAVGVAFTAGGRALAVGDNDDVRVYPLGFSALTEDPARMLSDAQRRAGRHIEGFDLVVTPPPPSREHTRSQP